MNIKKISAIAIDEYTKEQLLAQFPDIKDWDGVYHDSELTGLDSGYPPGSDGAHAWEKLNPGKKVVDVLFRDETDPEYAVAEDENNEYTKDSRNDGNGLELSAKNQKIITAYKEEIDKLNSDISSRNGNHINTFTYYGPNKDFTGEIEDADYDRFAEIMVKYNKMTGNTLDGIQMLLLGIES